MWERYTSGAPICTLQITATELGALRNRLATEVSKHGIGGLVGDNALARDLIAFASSYVAEDAKRLEWEPLLKALGVSPQELDRYPELYGPLERAFASLGREVIRTWRGRRFLASFLREGGLPANIGNLPELIGGTADEFGWNALRDEGVREHATNRVAARATGAAATLLATSEGRSALDDLLATAAEARAMLIEVGVDPTALLTHEEVRSALARAGIPLPSVRNQELLVSVLRSFTREPPVPAIVLAPLRLVARERNGALEFLLHLDLQALSNAEIPGGTTHVALEAEPCSASASRQQVRRKDATFVAVRDSEPFLRWLRTGATAPSRVDAHFAGTGGVPQVVPVATLEWEQADELWFDRYGEMLSEKRATLQPGECFLVVSWRDVQLEGDGGVHVRRLSPPVGAAGAWAVEATAEGTLNLSADGETESLPCAASSLNVSVLQSSSVAGLPRRFVRSLPDVAIPEGLVASVEVSSKHAPTLSVAIPRAAGFVRLSGQGKVRRLVGQVTVRVRSDDGRTWAASWYVLPPRFGLRQLPGCVELENAGRIDHVVGGTWRVTEQGRARLEAHEGETTVVAFISLDGGESLKLPIAVGPRALRLWADRGLSRALPLHPPAELTERMVYEGACLEIGGAEGSQLRIRSRVGDVLLAVKKRSTQRVFVQLSELLNAQWKRNEPKARFMATLEPSGEALDFVVHVPRLAPPEVRSESPDALRLEFALDDRDLPVAPGLAWFPIAPPLSTPAFIKADLVHDERAYVSVLGGADSPSQRGAYVVFLVDRSFEPPRPMSGGRRVSVPLSREMPPPPPGANAIERALWLWDKPALDDALVQMAGAPGFNAFADAFVQATLVREPYRLEMFLLWRFVGLRMLWLVLTCAARRPSEEQAAWLLLWARQIAGFSWLCLTRRDVQLLADTLPPRSTDERVSLLDKARAAHPMLVSTEHLLLEGLVRGNSRAPVDAARANEVNVRGRLDILEEPTRFELPKGAVQQSWLRGAELDPDIVARIDEFLNEQVSHGARARAVRELFLRRDPPGGHLELRPGERDVWGARVRDWVDAEWARLAMDKISHRIHGLDRECAVAALHVVAHRNGRSRLDGHTLEQVISLEQIAPALLDAWITAISLREEGIK